MEEERLWKFGKPAWLNSAWARNAGVYAAGALVRLLLPSLPPCISPSSASRRRRLLLLLPLRQHAFMRTPFHLHAAQSTG